MKRGNLSRRGFLERSLSAMAVVGLPLWYGRDLFAHGQANAQDEKKAANGRIVMGAIGIGSPQSRGRAIANDALSAQRGVQYVAICDVDSRHRDAAVANMQKRGQEVKAYHDFRELLDRKDIEAVTIATPDHWHALIAIDAMRKGKHVYCEKPLTLTIAESQAVARVAKETGRAFQVGSQQRSDDRFRLACELVRNGRLGKIRYVETRIGTNPQSPVLPKVEPPKELDWNFWLGPTPMVDYVELAQGGSRLTRCHYEFRWWYDYSGGKMTDWGAHHNDIAQWALGMDESGPVSMEAMAAPAATEPNRYNCHPRFAVTYTYANGTRLVCTHGQSPGSPDPRSSSGQGRGGQGRQVGHDNGILFVGETGQWIFVSRGHITASDPKLLEEPLKADATRLYVSRNHMANFLDGVRTGKPCICPADVGHRSVSVCHLGVIALQSGKRLRWDPAKEQFDDMEANKMLRREMRAPWKLEV